MKQKTTGKVILISKQWWLKINTKPIRTHALDGAIFPHVIRVQYTVGNREYVKRKWIGAGCTVPLVGSTVAVEYDEKKPSHAKIVLFPKENP